MLALRRALLHTSARRSTHKATHLTNFLAQDTPPPVQVASISEANGIQLADGLKIPGACIFLEGNVYLWDVPTPKSGKDGWKQWTKDHLGIFDTVVPRPGRVLLFSLFGPNIHYWQSCYFWELGKGL
jgi:NADH dehydrogenase [ubiquinone] 1 alpha subcomplex assembly factor 3